MFTSAKFYIIFGYKSLIIKKEGSDSKAIIDCEASSIPNIPFYYNFFGSDKNYAKDLRSKVKGLKIKNAVVIIPDDSKELLIDEKLITEFFMTCGVKGIELKSQGSLLSLENKKYISISKTVRTIVLQYIVNDEVVAKKYYEKGMDIEQIAAAVKTLHSDCENENIPVYINNINNDMEKFESLGILVYLEDFLRELHRLC